MSNGTMELFANNANIKISIRVQPKGLTKEETEKVLASIVSRIMDSTCKIPYLNADNRHAVLQSP